jgi:hypothetical protein
VAICVDCVHYDVCDYFVKIRTETLSDANCSEGCLFFQDKSKFIELPCSIGDTVYMISTGHDDWSGHDFKMIIQASFRLDMLKSLNKRFFLTREEAEKKLEEMNNDNVIK